MEHEEEDTEVSGSVTFSVDEVVDVDESGYWTLEDEDKFFKELDTDALEAGQLYSESGEPLASTSDIFNDMQNVLDTYIPGDPGKYRITCQVVLVYTMEDGERNLEFDKCKVNGFRFSEA